VKVPADFGRNPAGNLSYGFSQGCRFFVNNCFLRILGSAGNRPADTIRWKCY